MNLKVKYATMIVKNMEESISFYTKIMGFEIDSQYNPSPETVITLMKSKEGDAMIELIENKQYEVGFYSVGMDVKDMDSTIAELKTKSAKITMEPIPTLVGSCGFMEDPNGVRIALVQHDHD